MQLLRPGGAVNVGELEELLAKLPADMPVHISADGGCRHVTVVDKQDRRRMDPQVHAAFGGGPLLGDGRHPAALVLRADFAAPLWFAAWADDVPYRVTGRWPAKPAART